MHLDASQQQFIPAVYLNLNRLQPSPSNRTLSWIPFEVANLKAFSTRKTPYFKPLQWLRLQKNHSLLSGVKFVSIHVKPSYLLTYVSNTSVSAA